MPLSQEGAEPSGSIPPACSGTRGRLWQWDDDSFSLMESRVQVALFLRVLVCPAAVSLNIYLHFSKILRVWGFVWTKMPPCHTLHYCQVMSSLLLRVQVWEIKIPKGRYVCQTFSFKAREVLTNFAFQTHGCSLSHPNSKNKIHSNPQRATEPPL